RTPRRCSTSCRGNQLVLCLKCHNENLSDAAFCSECGAKLESACPSCGLSNPPSSKFCRKCGSRLSTTGMASSVVTEHSKLCRAPEGERRHLTILFCDLVGSTEIASHLDPEEWREIVASYHRTATQAIERFGGSVAQYLGDGVMASFGYPEAHDNDAERAV